LFGTTIRGNIRYSLISIVYENKSKEERDAIIIKVAKIANAYNFITALPEGYEINVGKRRFLLSSR